MASFFFYMADVIMNKFLKHIDSPNLEWGQGSFQFGLFVCLLVSGISEKLLARLSLDLVGGCSMSQRTTH